MRDWYYKWRMLRVNNAMERKLVLRSGIDSNVWPEHYDELTDELAALAFQRSALLKRMK